MPVRHQYVSESGYLLQCVDDDRRYKIVNFRTVSKRMTRSQREEFEKEELINIDEYMTDGNDLFECTSKMLFEMITPHTESFWDDNGVIKAVTHSTTAAQKAKQFQESVIPITFTSNVKKYLKFCDDSPEYTFMAPTKDMCYLIPERINIVAYKVFEIDKLQFTEADYKVLREFEGKRGFFTKIAQEVFKRCYDIASRTPKRCAMRRCFNSFLEEQSVVKRLRSDTIKQYGTRLAPLLFLLLRVNMLSIFEAYKTPKSGSEYTRIDTAKLQTEFAYKDSNDIDVKYLSQVCVDMMNGKDTLGHVLETLVMCSALKFGSKGGGRKTTSTTAHDKDYPESDLDEDEDEDEEGPAEANDDDLKGIRNPRSTMGIRMALDGLKAFLVFACMCTAPDDDLFDDERGTPMWKWIKVVYSKTAAEEENVSRYQISLVPSSEGVIIVGKLFDRQYIRDFYADCVSVYRHNLAKLNEMFYMPTVEHIAGSILRNRDIHFREPKRGTDKYWGAGSLLNMIPLQLRNSLLPKFRRDKHRRLSEGINKQVAQAVDNIACVLMWMVYFGAGFPYRFPELQMLAFSGPQRNVYVDDVSRRLQLFCDYSKTGSSDLLLKTLDPVTSAHVFFFIVILRQMQINALGKSYKEISIKKWLDVHNVTLKKDVTPEAVSRAALQSYMFLNSTKGDFIKYSSFRRYLIQFPRGDRQKLSFRQMRQAMTAILRHYVGGEMPIALMESMVNEILANHNVRTGLTLYGVDDFSLSHVSGTTATMLQERASERYITWLALDKEGLSQEEKGEASPSPVEENGEGDATAAEGEVQDVSVVERKREPGDSDDLFAAGQNLFGPNFKFRDADQLRICMDIYLSQRPSLIVHAAPGYGKTELFQLPLSALASKSTSKSISFVFVPYTVLAAACIERLQRSNGIQVSNIRHFMTQGYDGITDVYVGVYDDLSSERFGARIWGWENMVQSSLRTKDVKLGYIIIDEFHNLETEKYRAGNFENIKNLNFDAFEKVLLFSATAPEDIADGALRRMGFRGLEKVSSNPEQAVDAVRSDSRGLPSYPTKLINLISEIPLGHIHKEFRTIKDPRLEAVKLLKSLFKCRPDSKAIVMVNQTDLVETLAREWKDVFEIIWVHGKLPTVEKAARAQRFMNDGSKQLMIGTKLVTEGISISNLKMVIIINLRPSVLEFIQAAGRLRESGVCYLLRGEGRYSDFQDPRLPPITESCLSAQIGDFYGLPHTSSCHRGCCGVLDNLPASTKALLEDIETAYALDDTEARPDSNTSGRRPLGPRENYPFQVADRKRLKKNFHGWHGYSDIFHFLGFRGTAHSSLFLYGIDIHFCLWGVFTVTGNCEDCNKENDLCICPIRDWTPETEGKSYRRIAVEILAVRRMMMDDKQFEEHLEYIEPYHADPLPYLDLFYKARDDIYIEILQRYHWYLKLMCSSEPMKIAESERGMRLSPILSLKALDIYTLYGSLWKDIEAGALNVPELFFNFAWEQMEQLWNNKEASADELTDILESDHVFERIRSASSGRFHGLKYLAKQFGKKHQARKRDYEGTLPELDTMCDASAVPNWNFYLMMQIGLFYNRPLMKRVTLLVELIKDVWLFPHWLALQTKTVEMSDGRPVPFYMLVVAIFLELSETED